MRKTLITTPILLAPFLLAVAGTAQAAPVSPTSYDMLNGNTGSYQYWDDSYTGSGSLTTDGAALSGGVGDLTDGIIANDNWYITEAPSGGGPYLGWTIDPTIKFFFASVMKFSSVTFYFDDADGAGGVSAPSGVNVNGVLGAIADPAGFAPFSYTLDLAGLTADTLTVDIFRSNSWVFLSEVTFDGVAPVPLPAGLPLLLGGIGALGALRHRRKQREV